MFSALLFDLDGTLIDSVPDLTTTANEILKAFRKPALSEPQVAACVGDGLRVFLKKSIGEEMNDEKALDKAEELFYHFYGIHCLDRTRPFPEVRSTLDILPQPKAVVSNKPVKFTLKILDGLDLTETFPVIFGEESLPFHKPRPEPLWEAVKRLGGQSGEALMIGDSPVDIRAGKAAGMKTCAVTYGLTEKRILESEKPDYLIDRFSELRNIIQ